MNRIVFGKVGETLAKNFLEKNGYTILETNIVLGKFELDIIAAKNSLIIFVEVKTRKNEYYGYPEEAVNSIKQNKIKYAADLYLERKNLDNEIRFDIISIILNENNEEIYHIEDAF